MVVVPLEVARRRLSSSGNRCRRGGCSRSGGREGRRNLGSAQGEIETLLRQRHKIQPGADDDFAVRNISQIVATRTATTNLMSKLLGAVAGIRLIIGGIGIMNIMLVSVTERIREIGLRMAAGRGPARRAGSSRRGDADLADRRRDRIARSGGGGAGRRQDRRPAGAAGTPRW